MDTTEIRQRQQSGSDHLSTDPAIAPRPGQAFTALSEMQMAQAAAEEPEVPKAPVPLPPVGKHAWRFRTAVGNSSFQIRLDIPVDSDDRDENVKRINRVKGWTQRQVDKGRFRRDEVGKDGLLKADQAVHKITGEYTLVFTPVKNKEGRRAMEAEYVTSNKVIADYIRNRLNRGDFPGVVYEEVQPVMVEINGKQVLMSPFDETARLAMAAAAAG